MPSDYHNSITAKATGLIFLLLDIASARQVPFGTLKYVQCILRVRITAVLEGMITSIPIIEYNTL